MALVDINATYCNTKALLPLIPFNSELKFPHET